MNEYENNINEVPDDAPENGPFGYVIQLIIVLLGFIGIHVFDKHHEKKEVIKAYENGFTDASKIYDTKFRKLTEEFLAKIKDCKKDVEEYEALLAEYDVYIDELSKKQHKTKEEKDEIVFLKAKRKELQRIKKIG